MTRLTGTSGCRTSTGGSPYLDSSISSHFDMATKAATNRLPLIAESDSRLARAVGALDRGHDFERRPGSRWLLLVISHPITARR